MLSAMLTAFGLACMAVPSPYKAALEKPFRYAYKTEAALRQDADSRRSEITSMLAPESREGMAKVEVSASLPISSQFDFLEAPDGSTWFYTYNPEIEEVPVEGGYGQTEKLIKGYEVTIYDSELKEVGKIRDKITLDEAAYETRVAQVLVGGVISRKFFNYDDKYEVIIQVAVNRDLYQSDVYPTVNYHSYVYSIGGEKDSEGNDMKIKTIEGYLIESINSARDQWSEKFLMTFLTETGDLTIDDRDEFLNSCKMNLTTYGPASYSGEMKTYQEHSIGLNNLPGDQMNSPMMLMFKHNGNACLAYSQYEKNFYLTQGELDPATGNYSDPVQNEGNNLLVTIYEDKFGTPEQIQQTKIPVVLDNTVEKGMFTYYGVGNVRYDKDVDFGNYLTDSSVAALGVNKQVYSSKTEEYVESYIIYDNNGEVLMPLAEGFESFVEMSDIKGEEPQIMFIFSDGTNYKLRFIDLYSNEMCAEIGQTVNGRGITSAIDRVPYGDDYRYCVSMAQGEVRNDGNTYHSVCWLDSEGQYIETEDLNLGQNVAYATVYINQSTLDPYVFKTDEAREYMVLLRRNLSEGSSSAQEELSVISTDGTTLLNLTPDPEKGALIFITPLDMDTDPALCVIYRNDDYEYTPDFYKLPFVKFAGGDGTEANPYQIATAGDLRQIASDKSAHYKLVADIDAANQIFKAVDGDFSGEINGDGHTVSNLTIESDGSNCAFFSNLTQGASVHDINFVNVENDIQSSDDRAGVISANAVGAIIDNVHIYNLDAETDDSFTGTFGGIVGQVAVGTVISNSSVANAEINVPGAVAGGIVGSMRTGSTVKNTSFTGSLTAAAEVGGIAGNAITGDEVLTDCHVDADIVAHNTVGGIIGSSNRALVSNCYVEGSIEATAADRWSDVGPCAGGIVGVLSAPAPSVEGVRASAPATTGVVINNFVRLTSLKGYTSESAPEFAGQHDTMHRIIGSSCINLEPIEDQPVTAENEIFNNHAISTLAKVSADIEAAENTTEGASVDEADLNREFFENTLGFKYGEDQPWNEITDSDPALNHETGAFFNPAELTPEEGTSFEATLVIVSREELDIETIASSFSCESSDEEVAMSNGQFRLDGNNLIIGFDCNKVGTAIITVYVNGTQAKCTVNSTVSGVENVVADTIKLMSYNGASVIAPDCAITLYDMAGIAVANGHDSVNVNNLQNGIYIAVATGANGERQVIKIAVR